MKARDLAAVGKLWIEWININIRMRLFERRWRRLLRDEERHTARARQHLEAAEEARRKREL
jgi:hypothetical protein